MGSEKLRPLRWETALALMFLASAVLTLTLIAGSAFSNGAFGSGPERARAAWRSEILGSRGLTATHGVAPPPARRAVA